MLSIFQPPKVAELQQRCEMLTRVSSLLLEGVRLHSVQGQAESFLKFREAIQVQETQLEASGAEAMLAVAGAVLQLMSDYGRGTGIYHANGRRALQGMIAMLTQAIASTAEVRGRSIETLQGIIAKVEEASCVHDLESVKGQLEICLNGIKAQKQSQVEEQDRLREVVSEVSATLSAAGIDPGPSTDPVTGLRNRAAAQGDLTQALAAKKAGFVSLLRLETLVAINSRYGRASGDEYFQKVARLVAQQLGPSDRLFRWEGAVLLVLVEDGQPMDSASKNLRKIVSAIGNHPLAVGGRSALLQVTLSSLFLELRKFTDVETLIAQIDAFVYKSQEP